jgi:uncharacterized protein YoxC
MICAVSLIVQCVILLVFIVWISTTRKHLNVRHQEFKDSLLKELNKQGTVLTTRIGNLETEVADVKKLILRKR